MLRWPCRGTPLFMMKLCSTHTHTSTLSSLSMARHAVDTLFSGLQDVQSRCLQCLHHLKRRNNPHSVHVALLTPSSVCVCVCTCVPWHMGTVLRGEHWSLPTSHTPDLWKWTPCSENRREWSQRSEVINVCCDTISTLEVRGQMIKLPLGKGGIPHRSRLWSTLVLLWSHEWCSSRTWQWFPETGGQTQ